MIKVLFVCLGNICRSPMAEAIFRKMIKDSNLENYIYCDSAATSSYELGNPVYYKTKEILESYGISAEGMYSRQLQLKDLDFDYIVAMDKNNLINIRNFFKLNENDKVKLLLEYTGISKEIEDPYYTRDFVTTYKEIYKGCQALFEYIRKKENI